jgi:hypothetical protein
MLTRRSDPQNVPVGLEIHPGFIGTFDDFRDFDVKVKLEALAFDRQNGVVKHHVLDQSRLNPALIERLHLTQEPKSLVTFENSQAHKLPHTF